MNNNDFMTALIEKYDEDNEDYGTLANRLINKHFADLPASKSLIDPQRLGTQAVLVSKLRSALIDQCEPLEITKPTEEQKPFNKMNLREQLTFQQQMRLLGKAKWVHDMQILPENIAAIRMTDKQIKELQRLRAKSDTKKLREESEVIDVGKLMDQLLPSLTDKDASKDAVISALLLATGRRTIEVLKTAEFYLGKDMTSTGYFAMFKGQAKDSVFGTEDYSIPLLAPFSLCQAALRRVRYDTEAVTKVSTAAQINTIFSKGISNYIKRATKMDLAPHVLRAVYAVSCYSLLKGRKMSLIGYISSILGHSTPSNAAYYQRVQAENVRLWETNEPAMVVPDLDDGWVVHSIPERKRIEGILEIMMHKRAVTASMIRATCGGTMPVITRVIENNQKRITEYNNSL